MQSISVQSLLFSEVIKERIDLLAGDSYLLPPPPVRSTAGSPGRKSLVCMEAEAVHFATIQCTSILTLRFKLLVKTQCKRYRSGQIDFFL